jgi:uncharacterized membrane protein YecN with MAPEG domain
MRGSPVMKLFFKMDKKVTEEKLNRNIRAHGNFSEYVPLYLLLLLVSELVGVTSYNYMLIASLFSPMAELLTQYVLLFLITILF